MKKLIDKIMKNKIVRPIIDFFQKGSKNGLSALSVQGAYYVFASLVPFLILVLTILKFTPLDIEFASRKIVDGLPAYFQNFAGGLVKQIYSNSSLVISFSIITLLWTASKGIYVIIDGFNVIYGNCRKTNYFKDLAFSILYTILFVISVPVLIIVMIFGQSIIDLIIRFVPILNQFQFSISLTKFLVSTCIIMILLLLMYKFFPRKSYRFKDIWIGALVSTVIWQIFTYAFSIYVNISLKKASLYGSMSIILILLFWLYCIYYIIFAGAQINALIINRNHKDIENKSDINDNLIEDTNMKEK